MPKFQDDYGEFDEEDNYDEGFLKGYEKGKEENKSWRGEDNLSRNWKRRKKKLNTNPFYYTWSTRQVLREIKRKKERFIFLQEFLPTIEKKVIEEKWREVTWKKMSMLPPLNKPPLVENQEDGEAEDYEDLRKHWGEIRKREKEKEEQWRQAKKLIN